MSGPSHDPVELFVRAVHRRWVGWRALERAGLGILVACAMALPTIGMLWSQGQRATGVAALILAMGGAIGLIAGLVRRPSLLRTAIEADRQLGLHDLLATSLSLPTTAFAEERWRIAVRATARARVRDLHPSQLVLQRLGARTWSGIGLATALVFTVSLMTSTPGQSVAHQTLPESSSSVRSDTSKASASSLAGAQPHERARANAGHDESIATRESRDSNSAAREARDARDGQAGSRSAGDGSGAGAARSDGVFDPLRPRTSAAGAADQRGAAASGAVASDNPAPAGDVAGNSASAHRGTAVAPWRSATWAADRANALNAVRTGTVPAPYRDLVIAYFDRDQDDAR